MATGITTSTSEQSMAALQALLNGPAESPPPGMTSDFTRPPSLHVVVTVTLVICLTSSMLAVLMRMYTKIFLIRSIAPEDYALVLGWVGQIAEATTSVLTIRYGGSVRLGTTDMWNVRLEDFLRMLHYVNNVGILYGPTIFLVKLSILLQYLRIFVPTRTGNMFMFVGVRVTICSCAVCYVVSTVILIAICQPRKKIWNPSIPGHCFSTAATFQATGIFNVISDFTILILPIPCVWKLQLPLKRKLGLMAIFATGFFACVTSVARVYYTWRFTYSSDISYNISRTGIWTWAEIATGIIISCLPVLPKFFQHLTCTRRGLPTLGAQPQTLRKHKAHSSASGCWGVVSTMRASSMHRRAFPTSGRVGSTSVTSEDPSDSYTELAGQSITLDEYAKLSLQGVISGRQAGHSIGVPAPHPGGEV